MIARRTPNPRCDIPLTPPLELEYRGRDLDAAMRQNGYVMTSFFCITCGIRLMASCSFCGSTVAKFLRKCPFCRHALWGV